VGTDEEEEGGGGGIEGEAESLLGQGIQERRLNAIAFATSL